MVAALIGDKWLAISADEAANAQGVGSLGTFGKKDSLLKGLLESNGTVTLGGSSEVRGTPVILLEDQDTSGTLAVSTVGQPYPLQVKGGDAGSSGVVDLLEWNAPVTVTAPEGAVDLSAISSALGGASSP